MTKKQPKQKAARAVRSEPAAPQPAPPIEPLVAVSAHAAPTPKPVAGRMHRATLTPAGLRGRDLVRFLRIHTKKPYGDRGIAAIVKLAREAARLGLRELEAQQH
jgi:hypothetical protein